MSSATVSFPPGETGSTLLRAAMAEAMEGHPEVFAGLALPDAGSRFKRALPNVIVDFEARRVASADRLPVARRLAAFLAERVRFGDQALDQALQDPGPPLEPTHEIRGTANPGWVPQLTWQGEVYEGAAIGALVDRMREACQLAEPAAKALKWVADTLLQEPVVLSDARFALLGAGAELAPTPYLLAAGARVLWVDRAAPDPATWSPDAFAGTLAHVPNALDLLTEITAVGQAVRAEADAGPLHLGLYAYAPGRGRELLLTAAMNAVANAVTPASVGLLISPTTPGQVHAGCRDDRKARRVRIPAWQRGLVAVGALQEPATHTVEGVEISRTIVALQGPTYQAAQYLTKMMAAEAWAADRFPMRVSANVAGITHTRSLEHPLFLAGFIGAPSFGIHVYEPEQTRVLMTLLLLHDLLNPDAPTAVAQDPHDRAQRVTAQTIHGGVRSDPFVLESTIRVAALLGLSKQPSLLARLFRG